MLSNSELLHWLSTMNRRYAAEGMPHRARPFQAMCDFTSEHNCTIAMGDPLAQRIFDWFYEQSPPGSHQIGTAYTGIYLYDAAFWPVHIPLFYGQVSIDALNCLETMPEQIKKNLEAVPKDNWLYIGHWANCMDYGYGQMDLMEESKLRPRTLQFLGAAHSELIGANSQLLEPRPNVKAILGMRMAAEIFLKATLIQELDLTEKQLMKISHKLEDASNACADATKEDVFAKIAQRVSVYPSVSARYDDTKWSIFAVWEAATLTQLVAAAVTRLYTERDIRSSILPSK